MWPTVIGLVLMLAMPGLLAVSALAGGVRSPARIPHHHRSVP